MLFYAKTRNKRIKPCKICENRIFYMRISIFPTIINHSIFAIQLSIFLTKHTLFFKHTTQNKRTNKKQVTIRQMHL